MWNCNVRVHKYRFPVAQLHCPRRLWHGNGRAGYPKHRLASKVYYLAPWGKSPLTPNREALVSLLRFVKMCASHGPEGGSHYLEKNWHGDFNYSFESVPSYIRKHSPASQTTIYLEPCLLWVSAPAPCPQKKLSFFTQTSVIIQGSYLVVPSPWVSGMSLGWWA